MSDGAVVHPGRRPRRPRGSLSADEILRGAFEFVESESVDALSMPRLAGHLGVGVTSIYWYYKSKEDLLDAMTTAALERFYQLLPAFPDLPWDEHLTAFFREFRRIFRENHVLCDLVIMRNGNFTPVSIQSTWDRIEGVLKAMIDAGFRDEEATEAYFALSVYTRGCLMLERIAIVSNGPPEDTMSLTLQQDVVNQERYPILLEQSRDKSFSMVQDADFEFGLRNTINGLRVRLAAGAEPEG